MREIKFRGRRIDNMQHTPRKFVYGSLLYLYKEDVDWTGKKVGSKKHIWFIIDESDYNTIVDKETIGQYTGLKDSEGTEIYEGDILESTAFGSEEIGKVTYSEDDAMFELEMDGVVLNFSNESSKGWTVIGNIYENPELLEGECNG